MLDLIDAELASSFGENAAPLLLLMRASTTLRRSASGSESADNGMRNVSRQCCCAIA